MPQLFSNARYGGIKIYGKPRVCEKSVHGSTRSPRTVWHNQNVNYLAFRAEPLEGQTAIFSQPLSVKTVSGLAR
jgi:hypothetical protein